jgi:hypothetical protein
MNDSRDPAGRPRPDPLRPAERLDPWVFPLPVDSHGVGSFLMGRCYDCTADVARLSGEPVAEVGRWCRETPWLGDVS